MLVQCPNCKTTYKVSDDVVKGSSPAFRCSRCKHTFELEPGETDPNASEAAEDRQTAVLAAAGDADKREPKFAFPLRADKAGQLTEQPQLPEIDARQSGTAALPDRDERWSISPGLAQQEKPFTITDADPAPLDPASPAQPDSVASPAQAPAAAPVQEPDDLMDNVLSIEPYQDQQASTVPFLTLFGLLVLLFSFAAAYYEAHPTASEGLVGKIPLVGAQVLKNNHLKNGVLLKSLQGNYQAIQGSREVFIVTGTAVNQNPVVIRKVRLAGQIFSSEGKEIEQQAMWIGNALSPKIVRGMTVQDIADLQKLEPLRNYEIPPGDSVPFTLVFIKPNKVAKDFACEVTSAEGGA